MSNVSGHKLRLRLGHELINFTASTKLAPRLNLRNDVRLSSHHPPRQRANSDLLHKSQKTIGHGSFPAEKVCLTDLGINSTWNWSSRSCPLSPDQGLSSRGPWIKRWNVFSLKWTVLTRTSTWRCRRLTWLKRNLIIVSRFSHSRCQRDHIPFRQPQVHRRRSLHTFRTHSEGSVIPLGKVQEIFFVPCRG